MKESYPVEGKHPGSYVDPAGTVYCMGGRILRGIRPEFAAFYAEILDNPTIRKMLGNQIIETSLDPVGVKGYPLTLQHRTISQISYCYEWPVQMLKAAALLTLDICLELIDQRLILQDAYPWNIMFDGPNPILVDFTSIVAQDQHLPWVAYDQFCRFFLYPLLISHYRSGKVTRALLLDHINGIPDADLVQLLPVGASARFPWLVGRVHVPRLLLAFMRRFGMEKSLAYATSHLFPGIQTRRSFFRSLRRNVISIPLHIRRNQWSSYYRDFQAFDRLDGDDLKPATVFRILSECSPQTVVDIGCNRGGYSVLAARAGAKVIAFDNDETSIGLLYELAVQRKLNILPLVIDFLSPSPSCGWRTIQFPSAPQRLRSEMSLALALVHHLAITQRQNWDRIVPALSDFAIKWLLTEFVPLDDPQCYELLSTNRRDMSWYSLRSFKETLGRYFSHIDTFPSYPKGRILVLCTR